MSKNLEIDKIEEQLAASAGNLLSTTLRLAQLRAHAKAWAAIASVTKAQLTISATYPEIQIHLTGEMSGSIQVLYVGGFVAAEGRGLLN